MSKFIIKNIITDEKVMRDGTTEVRTFHTVKEAEDWRTAVYNRNVCGKGRVYTQHDGWRVVYKDTEREPVADDGFSSSINARSEPASWLKRMKDKASNFLDEWGD